MKEKGRHQRGRRGGTPVANMTTLEVPNPAGPTEATAVTAPRVDTLHGKKICMLWQGHYRGNETVPYVQQLLQKRFPDSMFVSYEELIEASSVAVAEGADRAAKAKGCDVVIGGNGG